MTNQPDSIEQIKALIAEFIAASNVGSLEFNQRLQQQEEAHLARMQQQEAIRERERQELDRRLERERFEFNQRLQQQEEAHLARMQQQEATRERERQELDRRLQQQEATRERERQELDRRLEQERFEFNQRLQELKQLTSSNAISIQALTDDLITFKLATEQANQEIRNAMLRLTNVTEGIAHLVSSLDSDRPTILSKLNSIENKIDRVLERNRSNDELQ